MVLFTLNLTRKLIMFKKIFLGAVALFITVIACADNQWGPYQWARTTASFDLQVVNSVTPEWDAYVSQSTVDWSASEVVNLVEVAGSDSKKIRRRCTPPSGKVRVCNLAYGNNGWLGLAAIYVDSLDHIVKGYVKLNDTYFATDTYNTYEWRQGVTCQELGHELGLDHQDTNFNNEALLTCMDYQVPMTTTPNQHDYDQLVTIYAHLDTYDSYASADDAEEPKEPRPCRGKKCNSAEQASWGLSLGRQGQTETFLSFERDGERRITYVIWAEGF